MNKASSANPCLNRTPLHRLSKEDLFWSVWNVLRATIPEQHRRKQSTYWERKSETKRNACLPPYGHSYCPQQRRINSFVKADFLMLTNTTTNRGTATFWEVTLLTSSRSTLESCLDVTCLTRHTLRVTVLQRWVPSWMKVATTATNKIWPLSMGYGSSTVLSNLYGLFYSVITMIMHEVGSLGLFYGW